MASISFAPYKLWQEILPWKFQQQGAQFGLFNVNIGHTAHPEIEDAILDEVGSYGKQIGRIGDVLEILIRHLPLDNRARGRRTRSPCLPGSSRPSGR